MGMFKNCSEESRQPAKPVVKSVDNAGLARLKDTDYYLRVSIVKRR
jgi:hypothetical protein